MKPWNNSKKLCRVFNLKLPSDFALFSYTKKRKLYKGSKILQNCIIVKQITNIISLKKDLLKHRSCKDIYIDIFFFYA